MPRLSRKYNKRIEVWKVTEVEDGFGGTKPGPPSLYLTIWANIITSAERRATDAGVTDSMNTVIFEIRYRPFDFEDTFFVYKGETYVLHPAKNTNMSNDELVIMGTKR